MNAFHAKWTSLIVIWSNIPNGSSESWLPSASMLPTLTSLKSVKRSLVSDLFEMSSLSCHTFISVRAIKFARVMMAV